MAYDTPFGRNIDEKEDDDDDGDGANDDVESDIMRLSNRSASIGRKERAYPLITPVIRITLG